MHSQKSPLIICQSTQTMMRGLAVSMVVFGHAVCSLSCEFTSKEHNTLIFFGKIAAPSVFLFIFLIGYTQGLKLKRLTKDHVKKRIVYVLRLYWFWATLAFLSYSILPESYAKPFTGGEVLGDFGLPVQYLLALFSFSFSWQYYYVALYIFFVSYSYFIMSHSVRFVEHCFRLIVPIYFSILAGLTAILWFASADTLPFEYLSILVYPNPLAWSLAFYLGLVMSLHRSCLLPVNNRWLTPLFLISWAVSATETMLLYDKYNTVLIFDQFSIFTVLFSIISLMVYLRLFASWTAGTSGRLNMILISWLKYLGTHSFLIFLVHLPFQWFILKMCQDVVGIGFSVMGSLLVLCLGGLIFPLLVAKALKDLPVPFRRVMIGY